MHSTTRGRLRLAVATIVALVASVLAASTAGAVSLNDELAPPVIDDTDGWDCQISPDGSRVLYRAEAGAEDVIDLYGRVRVGTRVVVI